MTGTIGEWEREVIRCIRCGACRSVCPVFKETGTESTVARGKVRLIKALIRGELEAGDGIRERMSLCLMCKTCTTYCPSGVKVDALVRAARRHFIDKQGLSSAKRLVFRWILKNRGVFRAALKAGPAGQRLFFRRSADGTGILPRLPLGLDRRRLLAPLAARSLRETLPERVTVSQPLFGRVAQVRAQQPPKRVAFFTGCMINYVYTDIGHSVVNVLHRNGVEVLIPGLQHCCGTPVYTSGDVETAMEMAAENVKVLAGLDVDAVVVACGSCGLALKKEYPEMLKDIPLIGEQAARLAQKVQDITEFILELEGFGDGLGEVKAKVTYHDPCHLFHGLGVRTQPRELIRAIPGVEFADIPVPSCCGSGGSFSLAHYEMTEKINTRKVESLASTGASTVLTGCPACRMQITDGIFQKGLPIKAYHTVQLLDRAYEAGEQARRETAGPAAS